MYITYIIYLAIATAASPCLILTPDVTPPARPMTTPPTATAISDHLDAARVLLALAGSLRGVRRLPPEEWGLFEDAVKNLQILILVRVTAHAADLATALAEVSRAAALCRRTCECSKS